MLKNVVSKGHPELQYLSLASDIIANGSLEKTRNGYTKVGFGAAMTFDLANNIIPVLTTKKVAWKTCLRELLWFISGSTDNEALKSKKVNIWNANGSRDFLDSRGLNHLAEDDLGPVYGHQWRHFNAGYSTCKADYSGKGVDQLQNIINCLNDPEQRTSRRMVMSAWNPCQIDEMALPPCHVLTQFNVVNGNKLSCALYQRSGDVGLGVPFNIASYSCLTHLLARHCNLEADRFVYFLGNAHVYDDHLGPLQEQCNREPFEFPTLDILNVREGIDSYVEEDFQLKNYKFHDIIKMEMRK